MSDEVQAKPFRVDYFSDREGPFSRTEHDVESDARDHAEAFVKAGPPDTLRNAYVSRPIATYYMRHSVASVEYTPISAPAQPVHPDELRSVPPATEEESGDQSQPVAYITTQNGCMEVRDDGSVHEINSLVVEQTDAAEDFTLLDPAVLRDEADPLIDAQTCEEVDPRVSWSVDEPKGYAPVVDAEPVLDATELAQVTIDKVPPTAEVIKDQNGRAKFALFGGQTHEVVEPSNTEADFWARVLHPRKREEA